MANASVRYLAIFVFLLVAAACIAAPVTRGLGTRVQVRAGQWSPRSAVVLRRAAPRYLARPEC